jgi:anti-sigma B factor antagonist
VTMEPHPEFDLVRIEHDGHPVVVVYGELDVLTAPRLHEGLEELIAAGTTKILVDLANVTFMDSTGLSALLVAHRHLSDAGGELRLVAVPTNLARTIEIAGLGERFHVYPDVSSAAHNGGATDAEV